MKHIIIISIFLFTACGDDAAYFAPYLSSSSAPESSVSSVSSASSAISQSSISPASSKSAYVPPEMLIAFPSHLLAGRWSGFTFDLKIISSNRHVIQSGCRYSVTSPGGIIHDHETGESWDSGIREDIMQGGIGYFRAGNLILITGRNALYGARPKGQARVIIQKPIVKFTTEYRRCMSNGPIIIRETGQAYMQQYSARVRADGTYGENYTFTPHWLPVLFGTHDIQHEGSLESSTVSGKTAYRIGEYYATNLPGTIFDRGRYLTDHIRVYDRYLFANGSYIGPDGPVMKYGESGAKMALFSQGDKAYWYDARNDKIVYSTYNESHIFHNLHIWITGNKSPGTMDDSGCLAIGVRTPQACRFRRQFMFVNPKGNFMQLDVLSGNMRLVLEGATNCSIAIIATDEIHGER